MSDKIDVVGADSLPEGVAPGDVPLFGAQAVLQDLVRFLSNYEIDGRPAVSHDLVMQSLATAMALLIAGQPRDRSPRDVRLEAEHWGKQIALAAKGQHEAAQNFARQAVALLGIEFVSTPVN